MKDKSKAQIAGDLVVEIISRVVAYGAESAGLAFFLHLAVAQFSYVQEFGALFVILYLLHELGGSSK